MKLTWSQRYRMTDWWKSVLFLGAVALLGVYTSVFPAGHR